MELANIQTEKFLKCFQRWQHRLEKCITLQGEYVEGGKVVLKKKIKYNNFYNQILVIFGSPSYIGYARLQHALGNY